MQSQKESNQQQLPVISGKLLPYSSNLKAREYREMDILYCTKEQASVKIIR